LEPTHGQNYANGNSLKQEGYPGLSGWSNVVMRVLKKRKADGKTKKKAGKLNLFWL
jgi:hypothetical protein